VQCGGQDASSIERALNHLLVLNSMHNIFVNYTTTIEEDLAEIKFFGKRATFKYYKAAMDRRVYKMQDNPLVLISYPLINFSGQ